MAVKIRMKRLGRRNRPYYRVVVIDSRKRRDGRPIEELGWYNPIQQAEKNYELNIEKIIEWMGKGAQPSDTVRNLLKQEGILYRMHLKKQGLDDKAIDYELQKWGMDRDERLKTKAENAAQKKVEKAAKKKAEMEAAKAPAEKAPAKDVKDAAKEDAVTTDADSQEEATVEEAAAEAKAEATEEKKEAPEEETEAAKEPAEENLPGMMDDTKLRTRHLAAMGQT
ncbi:MAG TPA: 30S ribosomal protein S16, partial [Candidatus Marinimicrobia bacterium]|nr:30S ribosomal protein S16 [Candidatus Neomarinimicrobiota bacterium]